jgi:hypothetical protein
MRLVERERKRRVLVVLVLVVLRSGKKDEQA